MPILYYADSVYKKYRPVAERLQMESRILTATGTNNATIWHPSPSWEVLSVALQFPSSTADYAISKLTGRGIIVNLNDSLWFDAGAYVRIVIPPGFYNGATLASALQSAMNANAVLVAAGAAPLTASYSLDDQVFRITAGAALKYLNDRPSGGSHRHSTAGIVFGLTANQSGTTITSNTAVPSLGTKMQVVGGTAAYNVMLTDHLAMGVDEALAIDVTNAQNPTDASSSSSSVSISTSDSSQSHKVPSAAHWSVNYREAY